MIRKVLAFAIVFIIIGLLVLSVAREMARHRSAELDPGSFATRVDLTPLARLAVHHEGRLRSFDSHASAMMHFVTGPRRFHAQSPSFTYLDLMLRPQAYEDAEIIYVKNKLTRARIRQALANSFHETLARAKSGRLGGIVAPSEEDARRATDAFEQRMDSFLDTGLTSPMMLDDPSIHALLREMEQKVITTKRDADTINSAMAVRKPEVLRGVLHVVPPPKGGEFDPWLTIDEVLAAAKAQRDLGMPPELLAGIASQWTALETAWKQEDAPGASAALAELATLLPAVDPALYPRQDRLQWESWYFKASNMTWVWLIYGFAFVPLMLSVVYRWTPARWIGLGLFLLAFGFHTFALGLRWYVSGRWPNSNMFEAVTTAAWFGGVAALVLELLARRTAMRNFFALGSAAASSAAFMAVHFLPMELNANISNMMPVLHDVWLYIHTNVIIFSYCLIGMAAVPAIIQLIYRIAGGRADYARVGGAGSLIMAGPGVTVLADEFEDSPATRPYAASPRHGESLSTASLRPAATRQALASSLPHPPLTPSGPLRAPGAATTLPAVLDGTTMVLMELAFVLLWTGLVMGAIWADHSWGRPWGWDPKEVFALNTFIIFALLVHVRLKVKDKSLWTALLAVAGCAVMLFNWIIINFTISGLHSYA